MGALLRWVESLLLVFMGSFMFWLANSPFYWRFMNPKYSWLTLGAGLLIFALGLFRVFDRAGKGAPSYSVGLLVFSFLGFAALLLPNPFYDLSPKGSTFGGAFGLESGREGGIDHQPRLQVDGSEYIKINVAELINEETKGLVEPGDKYAIQGIVHKTPELIDAGYIAVSRLFIFCCFADASGAAYLVKVDNPDEFSDGEWVRIAGTVHAPDNVPSEAKLSIKGALSVVTSEEYVLEAEHVDTSGAEDIPFIFQIRGEEPFAY